MRSRRRGPGAYCPPQYERLSNCEPRRAHVSNMLRSEHVAARAPPKPLRRTCCAQLAPRCSAKSTPSPSSCGPSGVKRRHTKHAKGSALVRGWLHHERVVWRLRHVLHELQPGHRKRPSVHVANPAQRLHGNLVVFNLCHNLSKRTKCWKSGCVKLSSSKPPRTLDHSGSTACKSAVVSSTGALPVGGMSESGPISGG